MVTPALKAGQELDATVVNMRFVKPMDGALVLELAQRHDCLVTVEENALSGGAGSIVNSLLQAHKVLKPVLNIALPDCFVEQGTREELLAICGLDKTGIIDRIRQYWD
jgi:1-deoxy-D-xylulose-5-phosphate synthase